MPVCCWNARSALSSSCASFVRATAAAALRLFIAGSNPRIAPFGQILYKYGESASGFDITFYLTGVSKVVKYRGFTSYSFLCCSFIRYSSDPMRKRLTH
jgi:hypothetical protein